MKNSLSVMVRCVAVSLLFCLSAQSHNNDNMRRRDPISIRVKAPSRGLVTRLPNELADQMADTDRRRTMVAAQNVRFEDGVFGNARGLLKSKRSGGLLTGLVHHFKFDEPQDPRLCTITPSAGPMFSFLPTTSPVNVVPGKIGNALQLFNTCQRGLINDGPMGNLDMVGQSFTICGWIQRTGVAAGTSRVLGVGGKVNSPMSWDQSAHESLDELYLEYEIALDGAFLKFIVQDDSFVTHVATNPTSLTVGVWYFFAATHTQGGNITLRVNTTDGTPVTHTTGIIEQGSDTLTIAGLQTDLFVPFLLDSVSIWRGRVLNNGELTSLYNGGSGLNHPFFGGAANLIFQGNYIQADPYPLFFGVGPYLYLGNRSFVADPLEYGLTFTNLFTMSSGSSSGEQRWSAADFYDKIIFAHKNAPPQQFTTGTLTRDLPGLPDGDKYEGVTAFAQHLLLWRDTTLKWSDLNDLAVWVPVAETIASLRLTTDAAFNQPTAGGTVQVFVQETPTGLTEGQFVRATVAGTENFYTVTDSTPAGGVEAVSIGDQQTIGASTTTPVFLIANSGWDVNQLVSVTGNATRLTVTQASEYSVAAFPVKANATVSSTNPRTVTVQLAAQLTDFRPGDYVSIGPSSAPGVDIWKIDNGGVTQNGSFVQLALTQVTESGAGSSGLGSAPSANGATIAAGANVVLQPYVILQNTSGSTITVASNTSLIEEYGVTLKLEALTGRLPGGTQALSSTALVRSANVVTMTLTNHGYSVGSTVTIAGATPSSFNGTFTVTTVPTTSTATWAQVAANETSSVGGTVQGVIPAGSTIVTLDANEAGEAQIVGASDNGAIYQVVPLGDYAVVFKNRAIQSVQYVGRLSGTFFMRTETRDEGLIGRNAIVRLNDNRIIFLGNRELYDYRGGASMVPVCQQYTRQLLDELDRGKIHEVTLHHKETRNEVWVVYPVKGGQKVLVWNYVENTASIDLYDNNLGGISAIGQTRWATDPTWDSMADSITWDSISELVTWDSLIGSGEELATLLATGNGEIYIHGIKFSRDGAGYTSQCETMDFDYGDPDAWKYVDVVVVQLEVKHPDIVHRKLYLEVGTKETTDGTITWSARQTLFVEGAGQRPCKVNPGGAGRYVRLRFTSEDPEVEWRVSGYEVHARRGNTY